MKEPTMSSIPPSAPTPSLSPSPGGLVKLPKSSVLAVFLSFILPGVGQIYVGQPAKAFLFLFGFVGCLYGVVEGAVFPFVFLIPFVYLFCLIDAYRGAEEVNARFLGSSPERRDEIAESPWWGAGLIGLGAVLLLNNLGWLRLADFVRFWPLVLIVFGAGFVYSSLRRRKEGDGSGSGL
jgi:TM2 domain-containing membrane protein YozV